ncbi:hypothetical protein [Dickeya chrysanthemi]|uniref:hypothetical protein n=1 Tax=Dickeya chrysanthemi TaxID=556 RepID=UPI00048658AF|nr:hypothetical protein [Dickeya chrysanthemi]
MCDLLISDFHIGERKAFRLSFVLETDANKDSQNFKISIIATGFSPVAELLLTDNFQISPTATLMAQYTDRRISAAVVTIGEKR